MTINNFLKLNPDFAGSVEIAERYWRGRSGGAVTFWHLLAEAPAWIFNNEYVEWYVGDKESRGAMGDFMEDNPTDDDISAIVPRIRKALGRNPPVVDFKFTRAQLVKELEGIAADAMGEGETYSPQNSWAITLYQAAAILSGDERMNDDEIRLCNAQFRKLEGKSLGDVCGAGMCESF